MKIKSVTLYFPLSQAQKDEILRYIVGVNNITEIVEKWIACEDGRNGRKYYEIREGSNLLCEMHHYSQVMYFPKEKD